MQGICNDWLGDYACWNVQSLIPVSLLGNPMYVWTQVIGNRGPYKHFQRNAEAVWHCV